jgi:predicted acyl esterase
LIVLLALAAALPAAAAPSHAATGYTSADVRVTMDDGVSIAATLLEPTGIQGKVPAILMLHGIGGTRTDLLPIAQLFAGQYAVLVPDFRGHGQSGGIVSVDGPREIQDVRELVAWLSARPEVDAAHIGGWGISLGGGAILRALVEGVPFAAVETVETWTDLYGALAPGNLPKTGAIFSLLNSVQPGRLDPAVTELKNDAFAGRNVARQRAFARVRSSRQLLSRVRTPLLMMQGRRDFVFDIAQATAAMRLVRAPHFLYVGDFGHSPSTFPGPDIGYVQALAGKWFSRYLRGTGPMFARQTVELAPDPYARFAYLRYRRLPATRRTAFSLAGAAALGQDGKLVRSTAPTRKRLETFGAGTVTVSARLAGGWSRLVAVVTARPRHGSEVVVTEGGVSTRGLSGRHRLTIRLIDDATLIPAGSRLTLTIASSSMAQDPGNLLYLDLPMPRGARVAIGRVRLRLPVLRNPISR